MSLSTRTSVAETSFGVFKVVFTTYVPGRSLGISNVPSVLTGMGSPNARLLPVTSTLDAFPLTRPLTFIHCSDSTGARAPPLAAHNSHPLQRVDRRRHDREPARIGGLDPEFLFREIP